MAVEVIDGAADPAQPLGNGRYGRFKPFRITTTRGDIRSFKSLAVAEPVKSEAARGGPGRYYVTESGGAFGLVGIRRPDGTEVYAHYANIETVVLTGGIAGALAGVARFGFGLDLPLLAYVLSPFLLAAWYYFRGQRLEGRAGFEADGAA